LERFHIFLLCSGRPPRGQTRTPLTVPALQEMGSGVDSGDADDDLAAEIAEEVPVGMVRKENARARWAQRFRDGICGVDVAAAASVAGG
jgi:hypothetical protein